MRRAAVSIASNIAEGAAQGSRKEFIRFLNVAAGSASEMDTHLTILRMAALIDESDINKLETILEDIKRMIHGLIKSLRN